VENALIGQQTGGQRDEGFSSSFGRREAEMQDTVAGIRDCSDIRRNGQLA
jgi:hypothetical protein